MSCPFRSPRELNAFISAVREYVEGVEKAIEEARERLQALRYLYVWGSPVGREAYERLAAAAAAAEMLLKRLPVALQAPAPVTVAPRMPTISGPEALRLVAALLLRGYNLRIGPYTVATLEDLAEILRRVTGGSLVIVLPETLASELLETKIPQALKPKLEEIAEEIPVQRLRVYPIPDRVWLGVGQLTVPGVLRMLEKQGVKVGTLPAPTPATSRERAVATLPPPSAGGAAPPAVGAAAPAAAVPAVGIPVAAGAPTGRARVIEAVRL